MITLYFFFFKILLPRGGSYPSIIIPTGAKHRVQSPLERWPRTVSTDRSEMDSRPYEFLLQWQEYTEQLYKKDLHDPGNHNGVITHLESDILECKVKWTLGSITANKTSGGDGIPVELFQTPKGGAVKVLHSIYQQI